MKEFIYKSSNQLVDLSNKAGLCLTESSLKIKIKLSDFQKFSLFYHSGCTIFCVALISIDVILVFEGIANVVISFSLCD